MSNPEMPQRSDKIRCDACPVMCYVAPGQTGACDRYMNDAGRIVRTDPLTLLANARATGAPLVPFAVRDWDGDIAAPTVKGTCAKQ